jgi:anti-sigma factor RsiW
MPCPDPLRLQAYFDGELEALAAAELEQHLQGCPQCQAQLASLTQLRAELRSGTQPLRASPQLRRSIELRLDAEAPAPPAAARGTGSAWRGRSFWLGACAGLGSALAAALVLVLVLPLRTQGSLDEVVAAHVRSLMPEHLTDVASSEHHTVKPWFAGHADVSPVVADFAEQGYRLVGGRADYVEHQRAAVVVYQHGPHIINVFSWLAGRRHYPATSSVGGWHVACWRSADLESCAVSDTGWDELEGLELRLREQAARERPPGTE